MARIYSVTNRSNASEVFAVGIGCMPIIEAQTTDRRKARRWVRLARRAGFSAVRFSVAVR